jgi:hypothetical protein
MRRVPVARENSGQRGSERSDESEAPDVNYRVKRLVVSQGQVLELIRRYGSERERREAGLA